MEKLFEAALHEKSAPSRFGTPQELVRDAPVAFSRPVPMAAATESFQEAVSGFSASQVLVNPVQQPQGPAIAGSARFSEVPFEGTAPDSGLVDVNRQGDPFAHLAVTSEDQAISAELGEILDAKFGKERQRKKRDRLILLLILLGVAGGGTGWVVANPERMAAMKQVAAEIKSVGDIKGMVAKYQKALDKIGERGKQIDSATISMGVDPASVDEHEDPDFDKEMKEMMGEDGGPTTAARNQLLRDKFGSVEVGGTDP